MTPNDALQQLLPSYIKYYNIKQEDVEPPFTAEAEFHSRDEQYFLVKSARLNAWESHEYVYFATVDRLDLTLAKELEETAWQRGLSHVNATNEHRSSDVHLVVLAETVDADAAKFLKKLKRYQSYNHMLQGWSHLRVIALETSTGRLTYNRMGQILKKLFGNIKSSIKGEN